MKIWIITSWNENLSLFMWLQKYNHSYFVYYDQVSWPYGDKNISVVETRIEQAIEYLLAQWVEKIIVSPIMELYFLQNKKFQEVLLPIFSQYIADYCFSYSLVWKIWIVWDYLDISLAQSLLEAFSKKYALTDNQKNIRKFNFPFSYWIKEVPMRKYFLTTLSYSDYMVNKVLKFDLRYFKDSNVDTLIPMSYNYFNFQSTISKYFNFNKCRFHKFQVIQTIMDKLLVDNQSEKYEVTIFVNWHDDFIKREKRLLWLIQKGKEIVIDFQNIA